MAQRRRHVQPDLPEELVEEIIAVLFTSDSPVKTEGIARLRDALREAQRPRLKVPPRRLEVFHVFCELPPEAQAVVADMVFWLRRTRAASRRQVRASLDALAALPTPGSS